MRDAEALSILFFNKNMLNIGEIAGNHRGDGSRIKGIVEGLEHNKLMLLEGGNIVDFGAAANTNIVLGWSYYAKWRIAGVGFRCHTENFTDAEDPELSFGSATDADLFGKMKVTYPALEKMTIGDVASYSVRDILRSILSEAETGITFTAGSPDGWNVWQTAALEISVENVAQLTTGQGYPFVLIEIDTGGKW